MKPSCLRLIRVSYPEIVHLYGAQPVSVVCTGHSGFKLTAEALEALIGPRTRWLILNSPCNPSGAVNSREDLEALRRVLLRHEQVMVLSDDIYEHLIFDDLKFFTLAQVTRALAEHVLTMNGVSEAYAISGWRIGYATVAALLISAK